MKIWIVKGNWTYEGPSDNFRNCDTECIEAIFDSESKAIDYILKELRRLMELRDAILAAHATLDCHTCSEKRCRGCLALQDEGIDLSDIATENYIKENSEWITYNQEDGEISYYSIEEYEVD